MGLRYPPELSETLLQGVVRMKESSTYQVILDEGRQEGRREGEQMGTVAEARRLLLLLGEQRFGPATPEIRQRVEAESGIERLEELVRRVLTASGWDDVLG